MFSKRLRALREDADLTQKEVAEAMNIRPNTYNRYECGVYEPDLALLANLADFFHVSTDYLLEHDSKNIGSLPELSQFVLTGDYRIFDTLPTPEERKRLAKFLALYYAPTHRKKTPQPGPARRGDKIDGPTLI